MMVNCPKCGFSQPQDQYCASCGVDMDAFRARHRASKSLFQNPAVQIGGLATALIAAFVFVKATGSTKPEPLATDTPIVRDVDQQETELAQAQFDQNRAREAMNETSSASVTSPAFNAASVPNEVSGGGAPTPPAPAAPSAPATTSATAKIVDAKDAKPAAGIRAALQPAQSVRVVFIEAQRAFLNELLSDARDASSDGSVSFGVVNNLDQKLKNSRAWQSLENSGDQPIKLNQPNLIFKGTRDQATGQNIGLTVQVIPISRDEAGTHLQVDANRTLRDPSTGIDSLNFQMPETFSVPKGASVVISGVLPHRNLGPDEQALYRNVNVLKAMAGERFRSGATDVAIIVQAR